MPNYQSHVLAGVLSGSGVGIYQRLTDNKPLHISDILIIGFEACLGAAGGVLPDKLEPPSTPRHRESFHSALFAAIIFLGLFFLWQNDKIAQWVKWSVTALAAGYIVHLLVDSFTPAGLPIA